MGFFCSLFCYRPQKPPVITGRDLAGFVELFASLGVQIQGSNIGYEVKFGKAIDQNDRPSFWEKLLHRAKGARSGGVYAVQEIDWDVREEFETLADMATSLLTHDKNVYRARLSLGRPSMDVADALKRVNSPENEYDFLPDSWGMELGPIETASFSEPADTIGSNAQVGWMCVSLSGNGYLFPWTFADLVRRAEQNPGMQKVMQLCKTTWPVPSGKVEARVIKLRKQLGQLWPYRQHDLAWDWYWGLCEG